MAGADVIEAAIGVSLLVIVGYTLVSSILTSGVIVASAQQDMTMQNEAQLTTSIYFRSDQRIINGDDVSFIVVNDGNQILSDISHTDILVSTDRDPMPVYFKFGDGTIANTWNITAIHIAGGGTAEQLHPGMVDPGEEMHVALSLTGTLPVAWISVSVVSNNGAMITTIIT